MFMYQKSLIVKMSTVLKLIYRFNMFPIEIPARFFADINKILKCIWESKGTVIATTILKKKSERSQSTQFQDLLYSYSNQVCVVLVAR